MKKLKSIIATTVASILGLTGILSIIFVKDTLVSVSLLIGCIMTSLIILSDNRKIKSLRLLGLGLLASAGISSTTGVMQIVCTVITSFVMTYVAMHAAESPKKHSGKKPVRKAA